MARAFEVNGKVAVVTGAGSGIGRSIARLLGSRGAMVHVADVDRASAEAVAAEVGGVAHELDVRDAEAVDALAAAVFAADGRVDLLFNNAGVGHAGLVAETPLEDWRKVVEVNLMGVVHVHAFLPRMLAQGRPAHIVNTASMAGLVANPGMVPYCTTKFGVVGLSEALDLEVRRQGVRVTALCPGIIDTAIVRTSVLRGDFATRRDRISGLYESRGTSPDVVALAALDAVARGRVIKTTPRSHVIPAWLLKRYAPPAGRLVVRGIARVSGLGR
jgi:NAD(P)-dependent dehydrogenase (short-subunit alcohol dehydrogenase family)